MKISEKEKVMLSVLGIVAIGAGYYYFGYVPQTEQIEAKTLELNTLLDEQTKKQAEIAAIPVNEKEIKKLNLNIQDSSKKIYPDIWQPQLIKELSDLGRKANIDVTFGYSKETYAPISEYFAAKEQEGVVANSLEGLIEEYNAKIADPEKKIDYKKVNGQDPEPPKPKEEGEEKKEGTDISVKQMKVSATFKGTYDNVMKFVKLLQDYKYRIAVPNISLAPSGNGEVSGSLNMEFYSVPRVDGDFAGYYDWKAESKKGKNNPFEDSYTSIESIENEDAEKNSLNIMLRPYNSDMPSVTVSRPDDPVGRTKLTKDNNEKEEVTVEFTQKDDEYFVKYQVGDEVYPKAGEIDFIPQKTIRVEVTSEKRINQQDMVAIKLRVKNSTDKKVEVAIYGDDSANPRVNMETHGDVYYISKGDN